MNKALLALLTLSLSAFIACSAKVADGENSGLLSNRSSELQTSSSVKYSSSLRRSSSQTVQLSEEASSSEDNPSSEAKSSTRRSSSSRSATSSTTSTSSTSTNPDEYIIFTSDKVLAFDKTKQHIVTTPNTHICIGESTPQIDLEKQVWLYWIESSTLYTSYDLASNCEAADCSTEEATAELVSNADDQWTGGTSILGTWESDDMDGLRISNEYIENLAKTSELISIDRYYPNVIGTGSSAKKVDHSTIEVPYNGHIIQFALAVTTKGDTLNGFHTITREDDLECSRSIYLYPSGSEPATCPTDSYLGGDNCFDSFETDVNTMEICDLDYLNDGECDDYCLNFDDADDCGSVNFFKKTPSKKIRRPLSKLRL